MREFKGKVTLMRSEMLINRWTNDDVKIQRKKNWKSEEKLNMRDDCSEM